MKFTGERLIPEINKGQVFFYEHLARYLFASQFVKDKVVLDAGSGAGYGSYILAKYGEAKKVFGVDISQEAIDYALSRYRLVNIEFKKADVTNLSFFKNEVFDVVVSFELIEHIVNQEQFLREIKRVLKKKGIFIISTPNKYTYPKGNIFHKKELYPEEFVALINKYFKNSKYFHQEFLFTNQIIEEKKDKDDIDFSLEENFVKTQQKIYSPIFNPKKSQYILAIASDGQLPAIEPISILSKKVEKFDMDLGFLSLGKQFSELYERVSNLNYQLQQKDTQIDNLTTQLHQTQSQLHHTQSQLHQAQLQLSQIYNSLWWKLGWAIKNPKKFIIKYGKKIIWAITNPRKFAKKYFPKIKWAICNPWKFTKKHLISRLPKSWQNQLFYQGERIKWAIKNPRKFFKKYRPKIGYLCRSYFFHLKNEGPRKATKRMLNYIKFGKGTLEAPQQSSKIHFKAEPLLEPLFSIFSNSLLQYKINLDKPIDILIPVYNAKEHLINCLKSIIKNTILPCRLLICDDASSDRAIQKILNEFKKTCDNNIEIVLLKNKKNFGFVKTVNKLAKLARNHFVVVNTDVIVPKGWLERLIYPIIKDPKVASSTPFTNACTIFSFPYMNCDNELLEGLNVEKIDEFFKYVNENFIDVPTGGGFCMAFNKKVVDEIGLFDEIFGKGYGEENDFCLRAREKGYRNILVPNLFVYHKHGGSFENIEKKKLMENNLRIIFNRYPDYSMLVQKWIKKDPVRHIRNLVMLKILGSLHGSSIIIDHNLGGGANFYRNELCNNKVLSVVITNDKHIIFSGFKLKNAITYKYADFYKLLTLLIKHLKPKEIITNNLVGYLYPFEIINTLLNIKKQHPEMKFLYNVHDFFCICPIYTLIDYKSLYYCGIPKNNDYCYNCFKENQKLILREILPFKINTDEFKSWREVFKEFLEHQDEIVCFSLSSKEILTYVYPNIKEKINVVPHKVEYIKRVINPKKNKDNKNNIIDIGIIGLINTAKGGRIIYNLAKHIEANNLKTIKLHLFGELIKEYQHRKIIYHGKYKRPELPKLMEKFSIDLIFIPSVGPETFSYTTEEAIKMGIPVAVFDLGAPAERVKKYKKGLILKKTQPNYILNEIQNFLGKLKNEYIIINNS